MADSIRKACVCLVLLAALGGATAAVAAESPADLQFDYAEGLYRDGLRKLAVAELEKFVKQYPKDPRTSMARFYLGECHHAAKDYKAALPVYEAAGKDAALPSRPIVMFRIGFCRFRLGDAAGSIAPLTEFLQTRLLDARQRRFLVHARYTLARAYFAVKDYERSLAAFQSVLVDPSPENSYKSYVLLPMGDCLAALGKGDEALARYREFEQYLTAVLKEMKAPERKTREEILIRVRAKVASLLLQQGKYDHALAAFGQLSDQGTLAAEVLYGRAQALFFLKRYQEALVASAAYIQRFPDGKLLTSALFIAGESCYRTSQFPQAEKYFAALLVRDAAGKHPAHETASFGSVAAAYRQGKPRAKVVADAAKAYLVKYEKTPRAADVRYFGAEAAFWLDDYATALEGYRAAPKDNAHAEEALHQTAVCLDHLKKAAEAGAAYDAYIAAFPQGVHYRNAVERAARLWGQLKQYDKAAERYGAFFDSFVKTDP
ncbi:tetratricopeptide repeat protein, partial [bacterium]|nr:tetratricopeptide repeat protein [bacterium]